jgi:hypothetical protein
VRSAEPHQRPAAQCAHCAHNIQLILTVYAYIHLHTGDGGQKGHKCWLATTFMMFMRAVQGI